MILKGSQRGGAAQLAKHLLRTDENEHVHVEQMRGFVAQDLPGALAEVQAVAKGTRCKQYLFSLSLNPPKDGKATREDLVRAADEAEKRLGLSGFPRAIVTHEKNGRLHAHAVWSRIDPEKLKAVNLPFFKTRLAELSKDLYVEHGWELPNGHKEKGQQSPLSFDLAEGQQAKRLGIDPKEMRQVFQDAWKQSKDLASFRDNLAGRGFALARGDRRGFVAVDIHGKVYSVARMVGIKTRELEAKLGSPDKLPGVEAVKTEIESRLTPNIELALKETQRQHRRELAPLKWQRRQIVRAQREDRVVLAKQHARKPARPQAQTTVRLQPPRMVTRQGPGVAGARPVNRDLGTGELAPLLQKMPSIRAQYPGEHFDAYQRYRRAVDQQIEKQMEELRALHRAIEKMRARQQAERLAQIARIAQLARLERDGERNARENRPHQLVLEF